MMQYKGYFANVEFDDEAYIFHGEVINLRDVITFESDCVDGLRQEFEDSVDDYLEFCVSRNEEPERPFSGQFVVRIEPNLHRQIYIEAKKSNKSINSWVIEKLASAVSAERNVNQVDY